ncbi:MAG: nitroreductase family protein [Oscillospiraceae bacterium]
MNEAYQNLINRKSVRAFTSDSISLENLQNIVRAGTFAPSAMNKQSRQFTVIQDRNIITKLEKAIEQNLNRENYSMYGANTIILVSDEKDFSNGYADCSCALENIFLAASSFGIGSVWINQLKTICDTPQVREILSSLKIPDNHIVWGIAALGYPANDLERKPRTSVVNFF